MNIIIIGAGLGGLVTGALLAKEGHKITILEKNKTIGGGLQTFQRYGQTFETGMHLLGSLRKGQSIDRLLRYLGIRDQLRIIDVDADCMDQITYLSDGKTYRVPQGKEAFCDYFATEFPHQRDEIRQYVEALYKMVDEIDFFFLRPTNDHVFSHGEMFMWPADRLVAHFISDPRLRDVLGYMNPMYDGVEGHTPAYIHALINVLYINGPSRFSGGSQQLADALADIIRAGGGRVISGDKVVAVDINDRRVTAVKTEQGHIYTADTYISAIHPRQLIGMTDSHYFSKAFRARVGEAPNSYSSFCAYIIFKPESFPYINHTCYFQEDYGHVWNYNEYDEACWPRGFMYMTPADRQQGSWATKMIVNAIMPYQVVERWKDTQCGRRGKAYEEWKERHLRKIISRMERLYPGFEATIAHSFASSPLTIRDYYDEPEGSLYGLRRDTDNIARSHVSTYTKCENLLLTGQNVNLHGFCGVPLTAISTAEAIVGRNVIIHKINAYESND